MGAGVEQGLLAVEAELDADETGDGEPPEPFSVALLGNGDDHPSSLARGVAADRINGQGGRDPQVGNRC